MAQKTINVGSAANSGGGDPLRTAMIKINENFTELYADIVALEDGQVDTDIKGSVFADDSTLLVDGVNAKIVSPTVEVSAKFLVPTMTTAEYTGNANLEVAGSIVYDTDLNHYFGWADAGGGLWRQIS